MGLFGTTKDVLVVDTAAVLKTKGVRGRAAPRQQLQVLRSLSRIVQRENLKVTAVLVGEALDKAPHNQMFENVRVRYTASDEGLGKELAKAVKQAGAGAVLVTDDTALEARVIRGGGKTLRISTFRKLLDEGGEQNENQNNGGNGGNRQQQRNRRDRGNRQQNRGGNQQSQQQQQRPAEEPAEERKGDNDTISQMIDLVD